MLNPSIINLISDTVTLPSQAMKEAMMLSPLGDDVFRTDPTVNELESYCAALFGHEASLFCPSGTMANQIAIKMLTNPLEEILCDSNSHVYQFEVGGYAFHSQVAIQALTTEYGKLNPELIETNIRPSFDWFPKTTLVCLENTGNRSGGNFYTFQELKAIQQTCLENKLKLHLDGARIFNAMVEAGYGSKEIGVLFDSITVCFSKGLGAPVGSILISSAQNIQHARRIRKVMGGGMRQSGLLASACLYALHHNISRLHLDHLHAKIIADCLSNMEIVSSIKPVYTNIIIFQLIDRISANYFIEQLNKHQIHAAAFGKQSIRFVTHLDISEDMVKRTCQILLELNSALKSG